MSGLALLPPPHPPQPSPLSLRFFIWTAGGWTGGFQGLFKSMVWPWGHRLLILWASGPTNAPTAGCLASRPHLKPLGFACSPTSQFQGPQTGLLGPKTILKGAVGTHRLSRFQKSSQKLPRTRLSAGGTAPRFGALDENRAAVGSCTRFLLSSKI